MDSRYTGCKNVSGQVYQYLNKGVCVIEVNASDIEIGPFGPKPIYEILSPKLQTA